MWAELKARFRQTRLPETHRDPKVVAEKLLAEALPPEVYLSLAATGAVEIPGKRYVVYRLHRNHKTELLDKMGRWWSACIYIPGDPPDQDRLVAEYLLITQDEKEYVRTANLTCITSPTPPHGAALAIPHLMPLTTPTLWTSGRSIDTYTDNPGWVHVMTTSCGISDGIIQHRQRDGFLEGSMDHGQTWWRY